MDKSHLTRSWKRLLESEQEDDFTCRSQRNHHERPRSQWQLDNGCPSAHQSRLARSDRPWSHALWCRWRVHVGQVGRGEHLGLDDRSDRQGPWELNGESDVTKSPVHHAEADCTTVGDVRPYVESPGPSVCELDRHLELAGVSRQHRLRPAIRRKPREVWRHEDLPLVPAIVVLPKNLKAVGSSTQEKEVTEVGGGDVHARVHQCTLQVVREAVLLKNHKLRLATFLAE
eukprot:UN0516